MTALVPARAILLFKNLNLCRRIALLNPVCYGKTQNTGTYDPDSFFQLPLIRYAGGLKWLLYSFCAV